MSKRSIALISATTAVVLAVLLGCLQSVVWNADDAPAAARAVAGQVTPALLGQPAASAMTEPPAPYFTLGRWTVAVYLLLWISVSCGKLQGPAWSRRVATAAGVVATVGDVLAYWMSDELGPGLRRVGFWYLELPSLALVTLTLGALGVVAFRRKRPDRGLALAVPAAIAGTAALHYLPHGLLAGVGAALLVAAAWAPRRVHTLDGLRVLVTGGTTGIGRATASLLHQHGARVAVCARQQRALPDGISFFACDLTQPQERQQLAGRVLEQLGGLDVLVNNAGVQVPLRLADDCAWSLLEPELALNIEAPVHLTTLLLPELLRAKRPAAIVNVTSALSFAPKPSAPGYCASKAALASFSSTLRTQLEGTAVRVLEVVPPLVETAMTEGRGGPKLPPGDVAAALVAGLTRGETRVLVGRARWLWRLHRVLPSVAARVMAKS